ncbi:MAG: ATP-binding protein [Anaerolineae bacterium]
MPKIAVSGKGGVGKTLFTSLLAYALVAEGRTVYAIDADPNPTLAQALGFPADLIAQLVPIVDMADLIQERTGARPGESGGYFRLNPRVDDIPARFSITHRGVHLMAMGSVRGAGQGCVCPENTMLKALVTHLLLRERETVIMDMVAGLEHLGRGTASAVDAMYVVTEPGRRSLDVSRDVVRLAHDTGIPKLWGIANKIRTPADLAFVQEALAGAPLAGWLPYDPRAIDADMAGEALYDLAPDLAARVRDIARHTGLLSS